MQIPRELYPFDGKRLDLGGFSMHYLDEGRGSPVLCVHGNPTWSLYYAELVKELARDHRVIAPDHVGCGLSDRPGDADYAYTLRRRVADLAALVDHLGIERDLTLVLHDWGGMIGLGMAEARPGLVRRLVLLNTGTFPLPAAKAFPWLLHLGRDTGLGAFLIRRFNAFSRGAARLCTVRPLDPALRRALVAPHEGPGASHATLRFVQDIPLDPGDRAWEPLLAVERSLPRYREIPVLLCWGMRDFVFDRHFLERYEREWPEAEVLRLPEAGHYVLLDAPGQVVPRIRAFLDAHPLPGTLG